MELPERIIREVHHFAMPPLYKNVAIYCRVSSRFQEQLDSAAIRHPSLLGWLPSQTGGNLWTYFLISEVARVQRKGKNSYE